MDTFRSIIDDLKKTHPTNVNTIVLKKLKERPLFEPLANSLEEELSTNPDETLQHLGDKLVDSVRDHVINALHISNSEIAYIIAYVAVMLGGLVTFVLLGIVAFSNGSTFSSLIGVAFPALGGSMTQTDPTILLEQLKEKGMDVLDSLSTDTKENIDAAKNKLKLD